MLNDVIFFGAAFLAGIAFERDGRMIAVPIAEKFFQFLHLAVCQGVHGINNDRLNAAPAPLSQDVIHDRNDVGEALARPCSGGQHVIDAALRELNRLGLVFMQA